MDAAPGVLTQISHRYVNSVALINAAFSFNLDSNGKTVKEARVVFGLPGALLAAPCSAQRRAQRFVPARAWLMTHSLCLMAAVRKWFASRVGGCAVLLRGYVALFVFNAAACHALVAARAGQCHRWCCQRSATCPE
jgi:hypothetical protein